MECEDLLLFSEHYVREIPNLQELRTIYTFLQRPNAETQSGFNCWQGKNQARGNLPPMRTYGPFSQWQSRHSNSPI
jgi:hypothetical protein